VWKRLKLEEMMQQQWKIKAIFLSVGFFILLAGCQGGVIVGGGSSPEPAYEKGGPPPWAPAHGYRAKHRYRYYPSSRVYYDEGRRTYFYYSNGRWQVSVSLPSSIHIDAKDYVYLEMDTDKPYEWNHEVVKKYPPGQMKKKDKGKGSRGKR
jgi:hypothetical protein